MITQLCWSALKLPYSCGLVEINGENLTFSLVGAEVVN